MGISAHRLFSLSLLLLASTTAWGQFHPFLSPASTPPRFGIGLYGGADFNWHSSAVDPIDNGTLPSGTLDQATCDCQFGNGFGVGAVVGLKLMAPIGRVGWFSPRLLYEDRGASFTTVELLSSGAQTSSGKSTPTLEIGFTELSVDLLYLQNTGLASLYLALGPSFSYVTSASYAMVNAGGATGHGEYNGDFQDVRAVTYDLRAGLGMNIPLNRHIALTPEALYSYPLTKISRWRDWTLRSFQGTLGIVFVP